MSGSDGLRFDGGTFIVTGNPIDLNTGTVYVNSNTTLSVTGNDFDTLVVDWSGNFKLGVDDALPTDVTVRLGTASSAHASTGTLDLNGFDQTIGRLIEGGSVYANEMITNTQATPATLTIDQSADSTYRGQTAGNLALIKDGSGSLTLGGTLAHTGSTTVAGGTLLVNGTYSGGGTFAVHSGAALGGTGTIGTDVSVLPGGILAPGASGGTLTIDGGDLTLSETSILDFELDSPASTTDDLVVLTGGGDLTLDGLLNVTDLGSFGSGRYLLFTYDGALINNGLQLGSLPGSYAQFSRIDVSVVGEVALVATIPEPSGLSLSCLLLFSLIVRRRQKR